LSQLWSNRSDVGVLSKHITLYRHMFVFARSMLYLKFMYSLKSIYVSLI